MKIKKILLTGILAFALIFSFTLPTFAKYLDGPANITNIDEFEFNRITREDIQNLKHFEKIYDDKEMKIFQRLWAGIIENIFDKEDLSDFSGILHDIDELLDRKIKKFEEKFGRDEIGRPYVIFERGEEEKPNLTEEQYEKIRVFSKNENFPSYEEYKKSWNDLNWMFRLKGNVILQNFKYGGFYYGFKYDGKNLRYYDRQGYIRNSWYQKLDNWYYFDAEGNALGGKWLKYEDKWYYLKPDFKMDIGWLLYGSEWYYLDRENGHMLEDQWVKYKEKWYYLNSKGTMAKDTWIGKYYVNHNGEWTKTR